MLSRASPELSNAHKMFMSNVFFTTEHALIGKSV
jgi:hypothetical protein